MKYIKLFEEFTEPEFLTDPVEIKAWLEKYKVRDRAKFEIAKDGTVTRPDGYTIIINYKNFTHLSVKFDWKYARVDPYNNHFNINNCENLTSLKGCPSYVGGNFWCDGCSSLTSLKGCPSVVVGYTTFSECTNLANLYYAPKMPYNYSGCKCTDAYDSLGYNEENHSDPKIHLPVAVILKDKETFEDILDDLDKKNKLDLLDVEFLIKAILDYPELIEPIMSSNLPDTIKSELKYAINLSKSDVKAKNIFD